MARSDTLILEVTEFKDPQNWRWVLKDSSGRFLQDQEVNLDIADPNYLAFLDLEGHLDSYSSPDKRIDDQERLLGEMSKWIGSRVLGKVADRLAECRVPTVVRVLTPRDASGLTYVPLELARVDDKALALRDLSLVFEIVESKPLDHQEITDKLRMLAIFSLPSDVSALAMRRERFELMRLISRIAQTHSLAIELRVLQYGVTRAALQNILMAGEGWDLIHLSGHGERAAVILENPDGTKDEISSQELTDMLSLARGRLKFVTLSCCLSAAATMEETLRWLKLWKPEMALKDSSSQNCNASPMTSLAHKLVQSLDCAVLAMRYPVGNEFATQLAKGLYGHLLGNGQKLPRALQLSLRVAMKSRRSSSLPPLSVATPALFGRQAVDLVIEPPKILKENFLQPPPGLAYFPPEPKRFAGRSGPLIKASSALAPEGDMRGVLFYGMAGSGKTACALELAYHHSRIPRFRGFVWYKAPDEGKDIDRTLVDFAMEMERQLQGFEMVHVVDDPKAFKNFLPILKQFLESNSILIVLDNLESLLTTQSTWIDELWKLLIGTLLEHDGYSRVILTSRRLPEDLKAKRLLTEPIHALSLSEAVILAREMPNLGRMLAGSSTVAPEKGRELVAKTLELVQGHPKLIELADAQASNPEALERSLEKAAQAWGDHSKLSMFFDKGESAIDAEDFLRQLHGWTWSMAESLPGPARILFDFICALEEADRNSWILEQVWPSLWNRLGLEGRAHDISQIFPSLNGLVDSQALEKSSLYLIHPSIAEAGLAKVVHGFRQTVDSEMSRFWVEAFSAAQVDELDGMGRMIIYSGLGAAPYLIRLGKYTLAVGLIEQAIARDPSPATQALVIPMLRHIIYLCRGKKEKHLYSAVLAISLQYGGRLSEAEAIIRSSISELAREGSFDSASSAANYLFMILKDTGQLDKAMELLADKKRYTLLAGLGPLTKLLDECLELQILLRKGQDKYVFETAKILKKRMDSLSVFEGTKEIVEPWNVNETILSLCRNAAIKMKDCESQALEFNVAILESMKARGATELELAHARYSDHAPLIGLKRYPEAEDLLRSLTRIFEQEKDLSWLGRVFGAMADLREKSGNLPEAIRLYETALRYNYQVGDPADISLNHNKLSNCLNKNGSKEALVHRLAAGVIDYQTQSGTMNLTISHLSSELSNCDLGAIPATFDQLCSIVDDVEGVKFRDLFYRLAGPDRDGDKVMRKIIGLAKEADHERGSG